MNGLRLYRSRWLRRLFIGLGFLSLLTGFLGVFLPVLPTVPFILLAAFCFARGSARFHRWLLQHRLTGPMIRDWNQHRSVGRTTKRWAVLLVLLSFSLSILLLQIFWLRVALLLLGLALLSFLWRMPVRDHCSETHVDSSKSPGCIRDARKG